MHRHTYIIGVLSVLAVISGVAYGLSVEHRPPQTVSVSSVLLLRSVEELTRDSYASILGTVEGVTVSKEKSFERTGEYDIVSTATIKIEKYLSNSHSLDLPTVNVKTIGGAIGDYTMVAEGSPAFEPGTKVVVFLDKRGEKAFTVFGAAQGAFTVNADGTLGTRNEKPFLYAVHAMDGASLGDMTLSELESRISNASK